MKRATFAIVFAIALAAYFLTMGRHVGRADTFEFQVTAPVLGVAHPTGYPLFILLGKLASMVSAGPVAFRVNLLSAVPAAMAAALACLIAIRWGAHPFAAMAGALALAFSRVYWSQAVEAEVYALNALLIAAAVYVASLLSTLENAQRSALASEGRGILALICGLGLTHHLTFALILPALAAGVIAARPRLTIREWARAAGLFALGCTPVLYTFLRWPGLHEGRWMTLGEFFTYITGGQFGGALYADFTLERLQIVGRLALEPLGWPGLILALIGIGALVARKKWPALIMAAFVYGAFGIYGMAYHVPDLAAFLIPMMLVQAVLIGVGVSIGAERISGPQPPAPSPSGGRGDHARTVAIPEGGAQRRMRTARSFASAAVLAAAFILPGVLFINNYTANDRSADSAMEDWGREILSLPLDDGAAILADGEKVAPLEYLRRIEGIRDDLEIVVLPDEAAYRADLFRRLDAGQTVYLARYLPGLEGAFHLRSAGELVEVGMEPLTQPPDDLKAPFSGGTFGDGAVELLGYVVHREGPYRIGETLPITLYWRANSDPGGPYEVRLRLEGPNGTEWQSAAYAVNDMEPANAWEIGEIVPDYYEIPLEHGITPGDYAVNAALYIPFSDDYLPAEQSNGKTDDHAAVEIFAIEPPESVPPPPNRIDASEAGLTLYGYDAPESLTAGRDEVIKLWWRKQDAGICQTIRVSGGEPDVFCWKPGAGIITRHTIRAEEPGEMAIRVAWQAPDEDKGGSAEIVTLPVREGLPDHLANFAGAILLTESEMSTRELSPGGMVELRVIWLPAEPIAEDYTVFAQLVGPDGRPHGQVDTWPVSGTFPTSAWTPAEPIPDRYSIRLNDDAPPGTYELHLGFYLLATGDRLTVIGADGHAVSDHFTAGVLSVE